MIKKDIGNKVDVAVKYGVSGDANVKERSSCPISCALDILGDKWTLLILRDMIFHKKSTYTEFLNSGEKIATNILADRLAILEKVGIITKQPHPEKKSKYLYKLTQKGIDLLPVLVEIGKWSTTYGVFPDEILSFMKIAESNTDSIIKELSSELNKKRKL